MLSRLFQSCDLHCSHDGILGEIGQGRGFRFECGDGFDQAGDGQGVAHAAGAADQAKDAAFASQLDGDAYQRGDTGAVDLGHAVEDDHNFAGALVDYGLQRLVKLFAGFANGEATADVED
jgi:hypothetical protein